LRERYVSNTIAVYQQSIRHYLLQVINDAPDDIDDLDVDDTNTKPLRYSKTDFTFSAFMINKRDSLYNQPGDVVIHAPDEIGGVQV
jgi:hypothetical protein